MKIETKAFQHEQSIPSRYTCQGENIPPELTISNVPPNTVTFVLIMDDPDAPHGTFDHWIVWNIPSDCRHLPDGAKKANHGINGYGVTGYKGPCPPPGKLHHYYFKLYALDAKLSLLDGASKLQVEEVMKEHIIETTTLMGTFQR